MSFLATGRLESITVNRQPIGNSQIILCFDTYREVKLVMILAIICMIWSMNIQYNTI